MSLNAMHNPLILMSLEFRMPKSDKITLMPLSSPGPVLPVTYFAIKMFSK